MSSAESNSGQAFLWRKLFLSRAKLKASSRTSALLSGFAMVAMVEIQVEDNISGALLIAYSICTTLLVSVHLLALMISTCILPHIEAVSNVHNVSAIRESPHEKMRWYIDLAWAFSTGFGIILFLAEIALLLWVKFYTRNIASSIAGTVIVVPVAILFMVFGFHFYKRLIAHKLIENSRGLEEIQRLAVQLDTDHIPNNGTYRLQIV